MSAALDSGINRTYGEPHASVTGVGYSDQDMKIDQAHLRLDESRRELKDLFDLSDEIARNNDLFPRSKVMRSLTGNGGLALLAMGASGLLLAKPKLVMHFLRMIPVGTLARMAATKFMAGKG